MDPNVAFVAWRALFIIMRKQDGQLQQQWGSLTRFTATQKRWPRPLVWPFEGVSLIGLIGLSNCIPERKAHNFFSSLQSYMVDSYQAPSANLPIAIR